MYKRFHLWSAIKCLSVTEFIMLATLFIATIGWVIRADSAITRGNERQTEVNNLKKEFNDFKLETSETLSEVKTLAQNTNENVKILIARIK